MALSPPASILVFGASGHIGGPLADWVTERAPAVRLRLAASSADKRAALEAARPGVEVVMANYFDLRSLCDALTDIEAVFVVTPDFLDEQRAMANVAAAAQDAGTLRHLVRVTGDPPGLTHEEHVPQVLRDFAGGTAVQHLRARRVLDDSGLPVTYLNVCAWFMDDFVTFMRPPILTKRTLCMPYDRWMNFLDCRDIGRAAAELLLAGDSDHHHKTYNLDNGVDLMRFSDVAALMTEVFGEAIGYDDSPETFVAELGGVLRAYTEYFLMYCEWERTNQTLARKTDIMNAVFGLTPRTFPEWLADNRRTILESAA